MKLCLLPFLSMLAPSHCEPISSREAWHVTVFLYKKLKLSPPFFAHFLPHFFTLDVEQLYRDSKSLFFC